MRHFVWESHITCGVKNIYLQKNALSYLNDIFRFSDYRLQKCIYFTVFGIRIILILLLHLVLVVLEAWSTLTDQASSVFLTHALADKLLSYRNKEFPNQAMGAHTDRIFKERHLDIGILHNIKMSVIEATETFLSWLIFVFLSIPVFVFLSYGVL